MRQRMRCTEIILELKSASGTKQKLAVLENNKSNVKFLELLRYAVDDSITFYLSESRLKSAEPLAKPMSDSIFKYFAQLSGRKWGLTDSAVSDVKAFLLECPEPDRGVFV